MALKHNFQSAKSDGADATQVQPSYWNDAHVVDADGITIPAHADEPAAPAADNLTLFCRERANRPLPAFLTPSGQSTTIQSSFMSNGIAMWQAQPNTTTPSVWGMPALSNVGTLNARSIGSTSILARTKRIGNTSAATAGSLLSYIGPQTFFSTGNGSGLGGFHYVSRFAVTDAAAVSGARCFVGVSSATGSASNVEPSTLTNSIGIAQLSTDATQWYLVYGGSAAQTAIALGTSLGAPTAASTLWELTLYSPSNQNGVVHYQVTNLATGATVNGTLTPTTPGTQTPANTTMMTIRNWRTNNATALAVTMDFASFYVETDQ